MLPVLENGTRDEPPAHAEEDALLVLALELGGRAEVLDLGFPLQFEEVNGSGLRIQRLPEGSPRSRQSRVSGLKVSLVSFSLVAMMSVF